MRDLELVTAPVAELVTLAELKAHLRVDANDQDALISSCLAAAVGRLDGPAGILGRALADQTWKLWLDGFPRRQIRLPLPPLIGVTAIAYTDVTGAAQTLAADQYRILTGERACVEPAFDVSWPATRSQTRSVAITFRCGWAAPAAGEAWPQKLQPLRAALKLMVGDLFANRETVTDGTAAAVPMSMTVNHLITPLRLPRT